MSNSKLTSETGTINLGDKFISVRLIKEVLEKHNGIYVQEEKTDYIQCRIFRVARLFGGPWPGPYPSVSFKIERSNNNNKLLYKYYWPEYFISPICGLALGSIIGVSTFFETGNILSSVKLGLAISIASILFSTICIHLDVLYFKRLLRKRLIKR